VNKKAVLDGMEQKIHECDLKNTTTPRLGMSHQRLVSKGLANVFRDLELTTKLVNTLYPDNGLDERLQEVFIELTTKKLQKHIGETVGKIIKPENAKLTFADENKMRNHALNAVKLANGEEIVTENFEEMKNVIKAEINVIILRNLIEQCQVLYITLS
jgi:hypothetical protein